MTVETSPRHTRPRESARPVSGGFRPEIQALRSLAMLGVVVFHLWPAALPGGYIGVDVFFVISGFLISAHLLREIESTGRVSLSRFYARRIRRLLPAAMLVLAVTAVGTALLVPAELVVGFLRETAASAVYVVNWVLAANAVDYFAATGPESPVQHYWSLSVEEQFYLVWPLLFLVVALIAGRQRLHRALTVAVVVVVVGCLVYSIVLTASSPQFAYFSSPAHAWQFAAGGLLALMQRRVDTSRLLARPQVRAGLLWLGLVVIVATMFLFGPTTPVPGWIAIIPTAATVAVMLAGTSSARWSPSPLLEVRPVQLAGDVSYSAYLWHWPLIVLAPYLLDRELATPDRVVILVATVVLAWLTRRLVEQSAISSPVWRRRRTSYVFAIVSAAVVVALCAVPSAQAQRSSQETADSVVTGVVDENSCLGAAALDGPDGCEFPLDIDPALAVDTSSYEDLAAEVAAETGAEAGCTSGAHDSEVCTYDVPEEDAPTVAVVGDSHAEHFLPALAFQAGTHGWDVEVHTKRSCPFVAEDWRATGDAEYEQNEQACIDWRAEMIEQIAEDPDIDVVVVAGYSHRVGLEGTPELQDSFAESLAQTWDVLTAAGKRVVVVGDTPVAAQENSTTCLDERSAAACSSPRDEALPPDPMVESVEIAEPQPALLDLTSAFCDADRCYAAIGGLAVYGEDSHHLTPTFSLTLAPWFSEALSAEMG